MVNIIVFCFIFKVILLMILYTNKEKGYCMRGDLCPFDHGVDRIVVDDVPLNRPFDIIPPMAGTPLTGPVGIMSAGVPSRPPYFMSTAGVRNQYDLDPGYCK